MNVLLDLDGTLTDPREGILGCIKFALSELGEASPPDSDLERSIGPPLRSSFDSVFGAGSAKTLRAMDLFRQRFASKGIFENMLYPGIPDALAALVDRGARLIVATSKPTIYAERIIEHFGLGGSIRAVYGSELDGTLSDKAGLIAHVLESERLSRAATSMVGDRSHDMIGARANEVIPVGVLWGYGSREELESSGASALCERPVELTEVLSAKSALEAGRARPPRAGNAAR